MKRILFCILFSVALPLFASVKPVKLDIYKNKTFLTKSISSNKEITIQTIKMPPYTTYDRIDIKSINGCFIEKSGLDEPKKIKDEHSSKIKKIQNQIKEKRNLISSLKESTALLKTLSLQDNSEKDAKSISDIFDLYRKSIYDNLSKIDIADTKIKKLKKELQKLQRQRASSAYKELSLKIICKNIKEKKQVALITYPITQIKQKSYYKINADTKNSKITLKNNLLLTQSTGEDFKSIDISVFTFSHRNSINPAPFYPYYVGFPQARKKIASFRAKEALMDSVAVQNTRREYVQNETRAYYKITSQNIKSGKQTPITLFNENFTFAPTIEIDGYGDASAFFKATFKPDKFFNASLAKIYLDQSYIGERYIKTIKKDQKNTLFFGADQNINIKKTVIKDFQEKPFFNKDRTITTKIFKYEITNNHAQKADIELIERSPVSKKEEIKIKIISKPKYTKIEPNGKTMWKFTLEPKKKKIIEFGYEIDKPKRSK